MKDSKNNKLSLKFDNKTHTNTISFKSKVMKFPFDMPCQINQFQVFMKRKGVEPNSDPDEKPRYTGGLSGVFSVPTKNFSKKFQFKIPLSLKHSTAIALSVRTGDIQDKTVQQLNKFVFGDEEVDPIIIDQGIWLQMFGYLIKQGNCPQSLKDKWGQLEKFIKNNKILVNLLLDFTEKQFHFGFYWQEVKIDGMPKQLTLKNIIFGLRLDFNKDHKEKNHAIKIGGQAEFQDSTGAKVSIYAQFSKDKEEVRLEVGATLTAITALLKLMGVNIPSQIDSFGEDLMISIQWIGDPAKDITQTMKENSQ